MSQPAGFTLGELAATLGATLEGDPGRRVTGVAALDAAGPEQISFLIDARYRPAAEASRAGALLVAESVSGLTGPLLRSNAPQQALIALLTLFH
ncbi:MAG: LpxD N-terminal domain-containing protein, partial [Candidatus Rokuibacteriota bacterium]